jgi:hypothetical protein
MEQLVCACRIISNSPILCLEFHGSQVFVVKVVDIDLATLPHAALEASICPGLHSALDIIHLKVGPPGVSVAAEVFFVENVELVTVYLELHPFVLVIETFDILR